MIVVRLLGLILIIITLVLMNAYLMPLKHKAISKAEKNFSYRFFIILIVSFVLIGIARMIQQKYAIGWLDGLVTVFTGLYLLLWGVPFYWKKTTKSVRGLKGLLLFLPGLLFTLLALGVIYLGITQMWKAFL